MEEMRLQKFLAEAGVSSRRKAEELILQGRVFVNGKAVAELGTKVNGSEIITVDGKKIALEEKKVYIMLNKPVGYVTTVKDQFSRPAVVELIKGITERLYPVGRLDYDTSGLLILTNDGEFTYKLTHPRHEVDKTYIAGVKGIPDDRDIKHFAEGINIDSYVTAPALLEVVKKEGTSSIVKVIIHEGKNRQVRKMCEAIGHPVIKLKRIAIGDVLLGDLPEGKWRYLSENEIKRLIRKKPLL